MKKFKKRNLRITLLIGTFFTSALLLSSCALIPSNNNNNNNNQTTNIHNLISQNTRNEQTELINNLSVSINYFANGNLYSSSFGTGYIIDNDVSNDNIPDDDVINLRHYYIITNTHVLDSGYRIIQNNENMSINQSIQTTIDFLALRQTSIQNPNGIHFSLDDFMQNVNNKFQVMGVGINLQERTWRDVEILRVSLNKKEREKLPQFEYYERNKNKLKFLNKPLITNRFLHESEQPEITTGGYPYNQELRKPVWSQFKQKNNFQWYLGKLKRFYKDGIDFKYNAVDYTVNHMDIGGGSSGSLSVLNDNSIVGNYWGLLTTGNQQKLGMVTPYVATTKMYQFTSNQYINNNLINEKRTITFANFSDSPVLLPYYSEYTIDLNGIISSMEFEQNITSYKNLVSFIQRLRINNLWKAAQNPDSERPSWEEVPIDTIITDITKTEQDIPIFKLENKTINQNIVQDWKTLSKNVYKYQTFLNTKK